ncbi:MAG: hypothetical protein KDB14_22155 [Planctomycetales bacterium]|nr:hypothetical protein [Planctomycetales bacterium]
MADKKESHPKSQASSKGFLAILLWPFARLFKALHKHWISYITGYVLRDRDRIYSVKFVWYGDSVYLHPMIWGSLLLYLLAKSTWVAPGYLLLAWFAALFVCYLTIMYNFNIIKISVLGVGLVALFGLAYISTVEWSWNPFFSFAQHLKGLGADVSPGFYIASMYVFIALIASEVIWAWLFHRVEIDESYVYEHQFLTTSTREPIFARGLRRETKDILELLLLGAADIRHRTKNGYKRFKNVPFASLWLGTAIDGLLDYRRPGQIELERGEQDAMDDARISDAMHDDDHDHDDHDDDHDDHDDGHDEDHDDHDDI